MTTLLFTGLVLLAALSPGGSVQKLNTIKQLKRVDFGGSVPKHSLMLLHWFANTVDVDNNDVIHLNFDLGDYGSHHYGNYEGMLNALPRGNLQYHTVGNLNEDQNNLDNFPDYVLNPPDAEFRGWGNLDRIIFRARQNARGHNQPVVDEVYITQHYGRPNSGTSYDPDRTYRITTNLLREIRQFSVEDRQALTELRDDFQDDVTDQELRSIRTKWKNLACLGLLVFIVIEKKNSVRNNNNAPKKANPNPKVKANPNPNPKANKSQRKDVVVNIPSSTYHYQRPVSVQQHLVQDSIQVLVSTGEKGKARITWRGVPRHRLKERVMVVLYKNRTEESCYRKCISETDGFCDTSVALNEGLHARLHKVRTEMCFWKVPAEEIAKGPEFTGPQWVGIPGYNASLQLYVKDGKACARLFVDLTVGDWRSTFKDAWVGFYKDASKNTNEYEFWQWQWATKFKESNSQRYVFEYQSSMTIAPEVQARFVLRDRLLEVATPCWV